MAPAQRYLTRSKHHQSIKCNKHVLMNALDEGGGDSENFGSRIAEIGVTVTKIWALEAFMGKTVFSGGLWGFLKFWEWLEGLGAKDRALAKCGNFLGIFG
jgi:hypothetical protein